MKILLDYITYLILVPILWLPQLKIVDRCRGQCYDGAAAMAGPRSGVATQLLSEEPRALFCHCYGHSLNLAVCDSIKVIQDAMDLTHEITKLIKFSPKRGAVFDKLKEELSPDTPGFRVLWTVRSNSLQSVLDNYSTVARKGHFQLSNFNLSNCRFGHS
jgi:hypothetical protein